MFEPTIHRIGFNTVAYYEIDEEQHISVRFACGNVYSCHSFARKEFREGVKKLHNLIKQHREDESCQSE